MPWTALYLLLVQSPPRLLSPMIWCESEISISDKRLEIATISNSASIGTYPRSRWKTSLNYMNQCSVTKSLANTCSIQLFPCKSLAFEFPSWVHLRPPSPRSRSSMIRNYLSTGPVVVTLLRTPSIPFQNTSTFVGNWAIFLEVKQGARRGPNRLPNSLPNRSWSKQKAMRYATPLANLWREFRRSLFVSW